VEEKMEMAAWAGRVGYQLGQKEGKRRGELGLAAAASVARDERRGRADWAGLRKKGKRIFPFNHL
jgi:hypothetical protein